MPFRIRSRARLLLILLAFALLGCGDDEPAESEVALPEVVRDPDIDWTFARDLPRAALQTTNPPRSRAVWIVVHEGELYVPAGYAPSDWPAHLEGDPMVLLQLRDRLYLRHASRITDRESLSTLQRVVEEKYGAPLSGAAPPRWIFRMDPVAPRA